MKLIQMEYFLTVAETLSFTAAAERLFVSQPALSKQITQLEKDLGGALFRRNSRHVELTEAGRRLQVELLPIKAAFAAAAADLERAEYQVRKLLMSGQKVIQIRCFNARVTHDFLPKLMDHIRCVDPGVHIELIHGEFAENFLALERDQADLVIDIGNPGTIDSKYEHMPLAVRSSAIVYSRKHYGVDGDPVTLECIKQTPLILLTDEKAGEFNRHILTLLQRVGITDPIIYKVGDSDTLRTYTESGYGYTILGQDAVVTMPVLDMIPLDGFTATVSAVWKQENRIVGELMKSYPA